MIKYVYIFLTFFALALFVPVNMQAQNNKGKKAKKVKIESRLVDQEGNAVPNATIKVGEGIMETFSDENGNFSIITRPEGKILIEARGYESTWVDLSEGLPGEEINLIKAPLFAAAQDVIKLPLMLETDQRSLTGAVSKISGESLESYPDLTMSNALQGRLMGLTARPTVNGLGNNNSNLYSRGLSRDGANQLITIVDGVERSIDYLIPEEIESIEVLKDPTTKILYGPRAANGVLLVTTKRGRPNTNIFKAGVSYGASMVMRTPEFLNSAEYATLYNEARENDGLTPYYSAEQIQGYRNSSGENDQRYPNADYYDYFLDKSAAYRKANLEYSGGNEDNQYALILGYVGANGIEKIGKKPTLDRISLRGNLDIKINDIIKANIGASGLTERREWGAMNNSQVMSAISTHRPNEYPFVLSNTELSGQNGDDDIPPLGGSFDHTNNLYGNLMYGGFSEFETFYGQANMGLDFNLNSLMDGLSANVYYVIDNYQYFESGKSETPVTYAQRWYEAADGSEYVEYYRLNKRVIEDNQRRLNEDFFNNNSWTAGLNYEKTFGTHELDANLTHMYYKYEDDDLVQDIKFSNTVLHLKHGFNNKLYTTLDLAYMGSDKMPEKNRYKLFPAVGMAWILSEENFMQNEAFFDFLKLKGSFGVLGYDRSTDYYLYENRWNSIGNVRFNERNNSGTTRTRIQLTGNPDLDWEKSRELNVGIEGLAANKRLSFEFNYFNEYRYDIIQSPAYRYSTAVGDLFPRVNQGEVLNQGFEGDIHWTNATGDLRYTFGTNFIFSKNRIEKMNEVILNEEYNNQTGKAGDAIFGYVSEGLFTNQNQLEEHASQNFGSVGLGNIAYRDLNNDKMIDELDRQQIGNSFPRTSLGVDLNLDYKRFGLYVLGTSELGVDNMLNNSYYWNYGERKYSVVAANRYHPTNNPGGTYPKLTTTNGSNDYRNSSFWIQDASFFRLKNVELSYTLPGSNVANSYRFHVRGTNLFVLSENDELDPEGIDAGVHNYPFFRTITGGVSVSF